MNLSVLYRGPLSSCNYSCGYCPFSKRTEPRPRLQRDQESLQRFVDWIGRQTEHRWHVLFTPWGEALVRRWYQQAVSQLSHCDHVDQVAIQTNLSCRLDWLDDCRADRVALWATFHPSECSGDRFVQQVQRALYRGVFVSAGAVAIPEHRGDLEQLRRCLPNQVRLWLNAQQPRPRPYEVDEKEFFSRIDSDFELTLRRWRSQGKSCLAGETVFTVDGDGDMRRCHFVSDVIGNIHSPAWMDALSPRACTRRYCDCYLGIAQLTGINKSDSETRSPFHRLTMLPDSAMSTASD